MAEERDEIFPAYPRDWIWQMEISNPWLGRKKALLQLAPVVFSSVCASSRHVISGMGIHFMVASKIQNRKMKWLPLNFYWLVLLCFKEGRLKHLKISLGLHQRCVPQQIKKVFRCPICSFTQQREKCYISWGKLIIRNYEIVCFCKKCKENNPPLYTV